jgi:hypothetical protein
VVGVIGEYQRFQESGKAVTATIIMKVEVSIDVESGLKTVTTGVDVKRPSRRRVSMPVFTRSGVLMVEPTAEQMNLIQINSNRRDAVAEDGQP